MCNNGVGHYKSIKHGSNVKSTCIIECMSLWNASLECDLYIKGSFLTFPPFCICIGMFCAHVPYVIYEPRGVSHKFLHGHMHNVSIGAQYG